MTDFKDDIFLSRWLNDELTAEELKHFEASEDYTLYCKIIEGTEKLQAPTYNLENAFASLKKAREASKTREIRLKKWTRVSVAASVILFLGFFAYFNLFSTTTYSSNYGEQLAFHLPDGSKVILNSKSTATFSKYNWENDRNITLNGEAFFDVEKGNTFTVNTSQGNVTVLGTEFNVNALDGFFNVACYEGKVKVDDFKNTKTTYLTPSLNYTNTQTTKAKVININNSAPEWLEKRSVFRSIPIKYVFDALEKQYQLHFEYKSFNDTVLFTGSFPNNNKHIALETVLKSVNLKYTIQGNRIILED